MSNPLAGRSSAWWQRVVIAGVVVAALLHFLYQTAITPTLESYDGPWHLLSGRIITETGEVPRTDPICFTSAGLDWINLNWLGQVVLYRTYLTLGFPGLLALRTVLFAAALLLFLLNLRARKVGTLPGLLALALVLRLLLETKGIRPRAFSIALLLLYAWILALEDPDDRFTWRRAGVLLGTLWLWNNLHGGFVYGYALIGMDALGTTLAARWHRGVWVTRRAQMLAGILPLGLLGFAVHPHGFAALTYAADYTEHLDISIRFVAELRPLDFTTPWGQLVEGYLLVAALGLFLSPRRPHPRDLLVALPFLHLALTVRRGVIPLLLLTIPFVAQHWTLVLASIRERAPFLEQVQERLRYAWDALPWAVGGAALLWLLVYLPLNASPGEPNSVESFDATQLPVGAARYLQESGKEGRIFNFYDSGGLLGWSLYPQQRIYLDGRSDLHCRGETCIDYLRVIDLYPGWKEHLDELDIRLVVMPVPPHAPDYLMRELMQRHGWTVVYVDELYAVLERPLDGG